MHQYNSKNLFEIAEGNIPGGVNSPVRAFKSVDRTPIFFKSGDGPFIYDIEDNKYIDYVCSWGPLILGHNHPYVIKKVIDTIKDGLTFGAPTLLEVELAKKIKSHMPSIELIRMVNSGTEACMSAIRLARGFTGKNKIIKFEGCYHGHNDSMLSKAGSGCLTLGLPDSVGVPSDFTKHTITCEYNNIDQVKKVFEETKDIAAIIIEPIAANMNMIMPSENFLSFLREICTKNNALLIFDEVITGFRVSLGGAQQLYSITPDLTCLGKVIGGGMPVGAFGGRAEVMEYLAPNGPVYQAGTLSGNPVAMQAGLSTITELEKTENFSNIKRMCKYFTENLQELANKHGIEFQSSYVGGLFGFYFNSRKAKNYNDVTQSNLALFTKFFNQMLEKGNYFAPSGYEAGFMSNAHTNQVLDKTLNDANDIFNSWKKTNI